VKKIMLAGIAAFVIGGCTTVEQNRPAGRAAADTPIDPRHCHYALELERALPNDRTLIVYLESRQGTFPLAFAAAPQFNRMPHDVDAAGLRVTGRSLAGRIGVTIHSDGYVPRGKPAVSCAFTLNAQLGEADVTGSFKGTYEDQERTGRVTGRIGPGPDIISPARFRLQFENAVNHAKSRPGQGRRIGAAFTLADGHSFGGKLEPRGSITDTACSARVEALALKLEGGRLSGTMKARYVPTGKAAQQYVFTLNGQVIADMAAGTITTTADGKRVEDGRFMGRVTFAHVPDPADSLCVLTLFDVPLENRYMKLYLDTRGGRFSHGFAATPNFNNATHEVDASGLRVKGSRVEGRVKVTVLPDPWIPRDRKPIPCTFGLDAEIRDGEIEGSYEGTAAGRAVQGIAAGRFDERPVIEKVTGMTLKLENALTGGNEWHNRAFVRIALDNWKVTGGSVGNNHTRLKGTVNEGRFQFSKGLLTGWAKTDVQRGGGVDPGDYEFDVNGHFVGKIGAGRFDTYVGGKKVKSGRFWGALRTE
jgi:hypothetical protein